MIEDDEKNKTKLELAASSVEGLNRKHPNT